MTDRQDDVLAAGLPPAVVSDLPAAVSDLKDTAQIVVPLHDEEVTISRRRVERDVVKVQTITHVREALINEDLVHERVEIERIAMGQIVASTPPVREEGDVTIIPVVEEIVVIEKRLVLKEEIHLRRIRVTEQHRETVALREQEAVITRKSTGADNNA